jgi:hypothetical protein
LLSKRSIRALAATATAAAGLAIPAVAFLPAADAAEPSCTPRHKVAFQTAPSRFGEWGTGTDADVQIWQSRVGWQPITTEDKYFEAGQSDEFSLCGDFVQPGSPDTVRIQLFPFQNDVTGLSHKDNWKVSSVSVDGRVFDCGNVWLKPAGGPVDCKAS